MASHEMHIVIYIRRYYSYRAEPSAETPNLRLEIGLYFHHRHVTLPLLMAGHAYLCQSS
jgi:hypothetical protein